MRFALVIFLTIVAQAALAQENKTLWTVAWSPNDQYIAIGGDQGDLKLFDGQTFELIKTYPVEDVSLSRLKWHPTQNKLAVITQSTSFKAKILDLDQNKWIELEGLENGFRGLDWNHNGKLLAVSEFDGEISIFDSDGKSVSRFVADPKSVAGTDWHPSQNILTAVGSRIGIFNHLGDSINIFHPRKVEVFLLCVKWHKSGEYFAIGDYGELEDAQTKLIQYWSMAGDKLMETRGSAVEYRNIIWSPDGEKLASANDALSIWDQEGNLINQSKSSADYLWGVDWNSDGTKIITTSSNGIITLWDDKANLIRRIEY